MAVSSHRVLGADVAIRAITVTGSYNSWLHPHVDNMLQGSHQRALQRSRAMLLPLQHPTIDTDSFYLRQEQH